MIGEATTYTTGVARDASVVAANEARGPEGLLPWIMANSMLAATILLAIAFVIWFLPGGKFPAKLFLVGAGIVLLAGTVASWFGG